MASTRIIIVAITLTAAIIGTLTYAYVSNTSSSNNSANNNMATFTTSSSDPLSWIHDGKASSNNGAANGRPRTFDGRNASSRGRARPSADALRGALGAKLTSGSSSICSAITRTATTIPASFDARTNWDGCISPVLNQASCGACWAFATAQTLSDRLCVAGRAAGRTVNRLLSPQQLVSCDHGCSNTASQTGCDQGCNGGSIDTPWLYTASNGLVGLTCVPYTSDAGATGTCPALNSANVPVCTTTTYSNTAFKSGTCYQLTTVASMQAEILTYGSVAAGMMAYEDFLTYESGVYTVTTTVEAGGHAVRLVGWGTSTDGVAYWIAVNQWSEDWGMSGTAYIRRGTNEAQIESMVVAAEAVLPAVDEFESYATAVAVDDGTNDATTISTTGISTMIVMITCVIVNSLTR